MKSSLLSSLKKNKVVKAGIGYTIGNYLLKGINFLTVPLFTRLMTTSDYGTYSIYMTYDAISAVFIAFALHSSLKNAKYRYGEKFDEYVSSILILPVMFLMFLLAVVNIFGSQISGLLDLQQLVVNILLCHSFANAIVMIYNNKLGLDYRYQSFLKISFINTISNVTLSLILLYTVFTEQRYLGRILGGALPLIAIAIYVYARCFRQAKPKVNLEYWKFGLGYSLPIIPHGISQIILSSFDRIMIKSFVGVSQAGIYSLGCNIEQLVKVTTSSLDTVWGPWFYEQMESKNYKKIKRISTYYAYGMFVLLALLILIAPEIVIIMGSAEYRDAKYVVIPLMTCTYFTFLYTIPATIEYYHQKTTMIAAGTMGAAALNIVLNYIFVRKYGYQAAAYTTMFSYFVYFVFHYQIAKKIQGEQLFNTKAIAGFIAAILGMNVLGYIFIDHMIVRFVMAAVFLAVNGVVIVKKIIPEIKKK